MRTFLYYVDDRRCARVKAPFKLFADLILFFHGVHSPTFVGSWLK